MAPLTLQEPDLAALTGYGAEMLQPPICEAELQVYEAHACVLQDCEVAGLPQLLRAAEAPSDRVHDAERDWVPPPHEAEQLPHDPRLVVYVHCE